MHITLFKFIVKMTIEPFFDAATGSLSYLVVDDATQYCTLDQEIARLANSLG